MTSYQPAPKATPQAKLGNKSSDGPAASAGSKAGPSLHITGFPIDCLLIPKEAARYLRVSLSWLAKARMRGDGPPFIRIGRSIRYAEATLAQWMKSRQRLSTSEQ
jgi:hypothetical protein